MNAQRFDALTKTLAASRVSRRSVVTALVGVVASDLSSVVRPVTSMAVNGAPPGAPSSVQGDDHPVCGDVLDPCGPVDNPSCCDALLCEVCDVASGQCRSRCQGAEACCDGDCRTDFTDVCGPGCCFQEKPLCCISGCVNEQIDRENCGGCGVRCAEDQLCDRGRCRSRCDASRCESFVDGACVVDCREDEVCDPERGCISEEPIDAAICETWMSEAELLELVAGGTSVTSLTSFDAINERGNVVVLCLWDVVGNPLPAEPWFEWLVQVQASLTVWGSESEAGWTESLDAFEADLGCAPAELPDDRTPACLREEPGKVDLTVRMDTHRFLWLLLTSSTTAGTPDYPELRAAAERIASFIVALYPDPPPRR
jgi:hypothetical protein